ncbi:MAG: alpha/beta fold hydrolase [Solirubrobacteraceae bacterium]
MSGTVPSPVPMPFTHGAREVTLAGDRWDGAAPPVLMLHGGGQTRHSWDRTARRLAADGRAAITLDARGHGDSEWHPDGDYSIDGLVEDLLGFVATLDAPPVLVGASMGGMTSLVACGENPGLAAGIVLVDVAVQVESKGVRRILDFLAAHRDGFGSLEEVAAVIAEYNPHRPPSENLDGLRKNVRQRDDGRWYWHWDPRFVDIPDEARRTASVERLERAARSLDVPVLLVRGGSSDVLTPEGAEHMLSLVPSAELADVSGTGHMLVGDDNDVFSTKLDAFLQRVAAA